MTLGLVDEVATDLRHAAIAFGLAAWPTPARCRALAERGVPSYDHAAFEAAAARWSGGPAARWRRCARRRPIRWRSRWR